MELIPRARLTTQFLESNASTHESVFGAIAEIVDNAYDSGAKKLEIDVAHPEEDSTMQGGYYLILRDYGCGMTASEIMNVIAYGWSNKNDNPDMIGMYGNGLKSGSMRVANDCLILSKKNQECSALMISQTFIKTPDPNFDNPDNEVICPAPTWKVITSESGEVEKTPIFNEKNDRTKEEEKHQMEVDLILQYSPFKTLDDLLAEFDAIDGSSGTCIYLYQLQLNERGEPELSIDSCEQGEDIHELGDQEEKSLKSFLSNLYLKPKMEIYLRNAQIRPVRIQDEMFERRKYTLPQKKFRHIAKTKIRDLNERKKKTEMSLSKAKGKAASINKETTDAKIQDKTKRIRLVNIEIEKYQTEITRINAEIKTKEKISDVKDFSMYLGYNIRNRSDNGLRIFHKNRLIVDIEGNSWSQWPMGVTAFVDVPASLMQPSMSKQRFSDEREFKTLKNLCLERAHDYAKRIPMSFEKWVEFGYPNSDPSIDRDVNQKTDQAVNAILPKVFRCTECGKYRLIQSLDKEIDAAFFICLENPDQNYNKCNQPEQTFVTKLLELMPVIKREKESSDVEEVAVSPEKKRPRKDKPNGTGPKRFVHDPPLNNRAQSNEEQSESSEEEMHVRRRLRKKRRSGFGTSGGNEVTSGFDRHRIRDSESESDESGNDRAKSTAQSPDETENLRKQLENERKAREAEKRESEKKIKNEREKNSKLTQEMKDCIKTFYPTSWKENNKYAHNKIDAWDYEKIRGVSDEWKKSYGKDLKKVVENTKQKKALKAKIEVAEKLKKIQKEDPTKLAQYIDNLLKESKMELETIEGKK